MSGVRLAILAFAGIVMTLNSSGLPDGIAHVRDTRGVPLHEVALPLREAWLRFHEQNWCVGVDTVFVFHAKGVEVWCRVKDEGNFQSLRTMLEALQEKFRVELYATHENREKKPYTREDDDPPPSLWNNEPLRAYMKDPGRSRMSWDSIDMEDPPSAAGGEADAGLKLRIKLFGDQLLDWTVKMERLAMDLPELASAGFGDDAVPDTEKRARAVCAAHAVEIGRYAERLESNLVHALPRNARGVKPPAARKDPEEPPSVEEGAIELSTETRNLAESIKRFLYPQAYTVNLTDLREPGLVDALRALRTSASAFQKRAK